MNRKIAILGAGPAGLALAMNILQTHKNIDLYLIEQNTSLGGLAGSFEEQGLIFDYGSHRLHPATEPTIMTELNSLLGNDLLCRPRNGRIRLLQKYVKFPLSPLNLALNLPPSFVSGILYDTFAKQRYPKDGSYNSFADLLLAGLGPTVCENFYFPYAKKLWGLDPYEISVTQAERRVSANSIFKITLKLLSKLPGIRTAQTGKFFYPKRGFGQISDALAQEVEGLGGKILLSSTVKGIKYGDAGSMGVMIQKDKDDNSVHELKALDYVFSTIPINNLIEMLRPAPPADILDDLKQIRYRAMVLFYFIIKKNQFTPYDAHYFPGANEIFSRMSEVKNYYDSESPADLTGLCLEIPCSVDDNIWSATDDDLEQQILVQLERVQLPIQSRIVERFSRRLKHVYPIYNIGYEQYYESACKYLKGCRGIISLGRQGLFMHNNTHHSLEMAYCASQCLKHDFTWDHERWQLCLDKFATFTVED